MGHRELLDLLHTLKRDLDRANPDVEKIVSMIKGFASADIDGGSYAGRKLRNIGMESAHLDPVSPDCISRLMTIRGEVDFLLKVLNDQSTG